MLSLTLALVLSQAAPDAGTPPAATAPPITQVTPGAGVKGNPDIVACERTKDGELAATCDEDFNAQILDLALSNNVHVNLCVCVPSPMTKIITKHRKERKEK